MEEGRDPHEAVPFVNFLLLTGTFTRLLKERLLGASFVFFTSGVLCLFSFSESSGADLKLVFFVGVCGLFSSFGGGGGFSSVVGFLLGTCNSNNRVSLPVLKEIQEKIVHCA